MRYQLYMLSFPKYRNLFIFPTIVMRDILKKHSKKKRIVLNDTSQVKYKFIKNYFFLKKSKKERQVYALFTIKTEQ